MKRNSMMNRKESLPRTVYTPDSPLSRPQELFRDMMHDLMNSRQIAWRLAIRDVKAQYRQSLLGFSWILLVPLGHAAIWILLAHGGLLTVATASLPYPAFVLAGTMLWAIFAEALHAPLTNVSAARDMLVRLNFPRESLILAGMLQVTFNALIKIAIILVIFVAMGIRPDAHAFFALAGVAVLILAGTALGLLLLPFSLLYGDIGRILPFLIQALMYLTPVVYPVPASGTARALLMANPLTVPLDATRLWLSGVGLEVLPGFALTTGVLLLLIPVLWIVYRLAMPIAIERMSS